MVKDKAIISIITLSIVLGIWIIIIIINRANLINKILMEITKIIIIMVVIIIYSNILINWRGFTALIIQWIRVYQSCMTKKANTIALIYIFMIRTLLIRITINAW